MTQPVQIPQPNFCFVFIDLTTSATPDALRPAPAFQAMIDAISEQVGGDFADAHGHVTMACRVGSGSSDRGVGEIAVNFRDNLPDAPGALADHSETNGVPDIEVGCGLFQTLTDGSNGQEAVSGGVDHEILELIKDAGANGWKDKSDGSGRTACEEVCDPVQNTGYPASNGVWLSNFVLASYWVPGAPAPWDLLGVMTSQSDLSKGYEIQATAPTDFQQVQGAHKNAALANGKCIYAVGIEHLSESARKRKLSPYCRTYRRGVRLAVAA